MQNKIFKTWVTPQELKGAAKKIADKVGAKLQSRRESIAMTNLTTPKNVPNRNDFSKFEDVTEEDDDTSIDLESGTKGPSA